MAQAHRVAELAFMGFLFFLLRNVMSAISVAQARRVTELAFHDIFNDITKKQWGTLKNPKQD